MSHVVSVTPTSATLASGASQNFVVNVSGVPGDDTHVLSFVGNDNVPVSVTVTRDNPDLVGKVGGTPLANEVSGSITSGGGTLTVVGVSGNDVTFRYTAP